MKNVKVTIAMLAMMFLTGSAQAGPKVIRATELGPTMWSDLNLGKLGDVVVEFRQGDYLPVTFVAQGDLIETRQFSVSYVGVKRNFWLQLNQNNVEISLDGTTFRKISDVLTGALEAGAGSAQNGGLADAINITFKALLK
jgi:hypothetical protein